MLHRLLRHDSVFVQSREAHQGVDHLFKAQLINTCPKDSDNETESDCRRFRSGVSKKSMK